MSDDPLAEIISMSNDDKIGKNEVDEDLTDDTTDDEISDDDVNDMKRSEKSSEAKGKKFTESKKKKKKKINKKLLNRDLKNNKLRQIRISLPYDPNKNGEDKTDSPGSVIDYNESEEVENVGKVDNVGKVKKVKVPIHKRRWFKVLIIVLITIACSILVSITSIKVYKYAKGKIDEMKNEKANGMNEIKNFGINGGNGKNNSNVISSGLWSNETKEDEVKEEPNYDKMINQVGNIKGGKKLIETKNNSINSNSGPPRDSKGRFMKRK